MMEKSALTSEGGGWTTTPLSAYITITYKVAVYRTVLLRGQIRSLYFISTLYVLYGMNFEP
jgi:hypothetical protein